MANDGNDRAVLYIINRGRLIYDVIAIALHRSWLVCNIENAYKERRKIEYYKDTSCDSRKRPGHLLTLSGRCRSGFSLNIQTIPPSPPLLPCFVL
ncbi:Kinesin-like protein [Trichinella pseudospiralis]